MAKDFNKINIHFDNRNRAIFLDQFTKKAYIIDNDSLNTYEFYHNRYLAAYAIFLLLSIMNIYLASGVAITALIILECLFRFIFLPKFRIIENYVMPKSSIEPNVKRQYLMRGLIFTALALLLVASTFTVKTDEQTIILVYGVAAFALVNGINNIKIFISK